jgi:hypothetical protein
MRSVHVLVVLALLGMGPAPCPAADPADRAAKDRPPEFIEMFRMILQKGADMAPGDGWFHPAQARYGWNWLAGRFDRDGDGAINAEELAAPPRFFRRLDRDGDGLINAEDLDWSGRSAFLQGQMMARARFRALDVDSNGKVARREWDALFDRLASEKGYLTAEDLAAAFYTTPSRPRTPPKDQAKAPVPSGMPSRSTLLLGLLRGELGSPFEGPKIDQEAPDFALRTHDGKNLIALSSFRGEKPVVLIFGSFT